MLQLRIFIASMMSLTSTQASAEFADFQEIGNWKIKSQINPMNDNKSCMAIYKDRFEIQLSSSSLAVSLRGRGGVRAYSLRFDNDAALPTEIPSSSEARMGAFFVEGQRFKRLLSSQRLRIQVSTLLSTIVYEDINMVDGNSAISSIARCEAS